MFEILAYLVMSQFGVGWLAWIASVICNTIVQVNFMYFFNSQLWKKSYNLKITKYGQDIILSAAAVKPSK